MAARFAFGSGWYLKSQQLRYFTSETEGGTIQVGPYGRGGSPGIRLSGDYSDDVTIDGLSTSGDTCIVQADVRISEDDGIGDVLLGIRSGGNFQCTVNRKADGTLGVYNTYPALTGLIASSTEVFPLGTHVHFGVKAVIAASGSILIHVWEDGDVAAQVFINATGIDTRGLGSGTWDGVHFGAAVASGTTDWSNGIVMDGSGSVNNDLLGPADVFERHVTAQGAHTDSTPSTGFDRADMVDDTTADDDITVNHFYAADTLDTFTVQPAPFPDRQVAFSILVLVAKKAGGSPTLAPVARQDSSDTIGPAASLTSDYAAYFTPYDTAPDGTSWTPEIWNAIEWGGKRTA